MSTKGDDCSIDHHESAVGCQGRGCVRTARSRATCVERADARAARQLLDTIAIVVVLFGDIIRNAWAAYIRCSARRTDVYVPQQ